MSHYVTGVQCQIGGVLYLVTVTVYSFQTDGAVTLRRIRRCRERQNNIVSCAVGRKHLGGHHGGTSLGQNVLP